MQTQTNASKFVAATFAAYLSIFSDAYGNDDNNNNLAKGLSGATGAAHEATGLGASLGIASKANAGKEIGEKLGSGNFPGAAGQAVGEVAKQKFSPKAAARCASSVAKSRLRIRFKIIGVPIAGAACAVGADIGIDKTVTDPVSEMARTAMRNQYGHHADTQYNQGENYASDPVEKLPNNWPRDNSTLEEADRFTNTTPSGLNDPIQSTTIPYKSGQGIKCGPISAAERQQLEAAGGYYAHLENSIFWREKNLPRSRRSGVTMGDLKTGKTISSYTFKKNLLEEYKNRLKSMLVELRNQNGYCPAPIGENPPAPPQVSPPIIDSKNTPSGEINNPSADKNVPAGYRRIGPNSCVNSIADVIRC